MKRALFSFSSTRWREPGRRDSVARAQPCAGQPALGCLLESVNQQMTELINGVARVNAGPTTAKCMDMALSEA